MSDAVKFANDVDVLEALRRACQKSGAQYRWAEEHGFSPAYVGDVLRGVRKISPKIARAIGFKKVTLFEPLKPRS